MLIVLEDYQGCLPSIIKIGPSVQGVIFLYIHLALLEGLLEKQLSIEYNIAPPDGSAVVVEIGAWFDLRINRKSCNAC